MENLQKQKDSLNITKTVSLNFEENALPDDFQSSFSDKNVWRYQIEEELGRGGIGRVLIAFDNKIGRKIALKELIKREPSAPEKIVPLDKIKADEARFLREAKVTGQLEHPGIVPVYEIGQKKDGNHYYTMRLVRGVTLSQAIDEAGTLEKRLRLLPHFRDICNAVAYSHSRGVIHRDIKPANIMIGEFGETVVLDWGLAKVKGESDTIDLKLREELNILKIENVARTIDGKAVGTPAYMSPEQARGEIANIDERSDVYSLGAVLYEILTGNPPFKGRNVQETLKKVKSERPIEIKAYEPDAPSDLCAVVSKTLTKERALRYQSALDVAREIENFMSGGKIKAYEYSSFELVRRFASKNRALTTLLVVLFSVLIFSSLMVFHAYRESLKNEKKANLNLSLGYLEYAEKSLKEKRFANAKIFSAASLYHNPYNAKSPWHYSESYLLKNIKETSNQMLTLQSSLYLAAVQNNNAFNRNLTSIEFDARRVALSPDGSLFAVAGKKREPVVYSSSDGGEKFVLTGHQDDVSAIEFSPNGKYIATGSWDKNLNLWDAQSGALIKSLSISADEIYSLAFSNDSDYIAFGGAEKVVWVIKTSDFLLVKRFDLENSVRSIDWSPDGKSIVAADNSGKIYLWEGENAAKLFDFHSEPVISVKFLKGGDNFISAGYDKKLLFWNKASDKPTDILEHWDAFFDLDISSDGKFAAAAARDGTIKLINLKNRQISELRDHLGAVYSLVFMPMGDSLISIGDDRIIKIWRTEISSQMQTFSGHTTYIPSLAYSPDGKFIASSSWDTTLKLWEIKSGKLLSSFGGGETVSYGVAFSPDGQFLATGDSDGFLRLWNPINGKMISAFSGHSDQISSIAFSHDGAFLVTGSKDKSVKIWDMAKKRAVKTLLHANPVQTVAVSLDGKILVSAGRNGEINFWSLPSGKNIFGTKGAGKTILSVAISPDGKTAISANEEGILSKWSIAKKRSVETFSDSSGPINSVAFSNDGSTFISAGKNIVIRESKNGAILLRFELQYNAYSAVFERDGLHFSVGDGAIIKRYPLIFEMWRKDPKKLLEESQKEAGKRLQGFKLIPF